MDKNALDYNLNSSQTFNSSIGKSNSTTFVKPCPCISRIINLEIKRVLLGNSYLDFFSNEHQSQLICGFLALLNLKLCGILLFTKLQQMNSETLYLIKKRGNNRPGGMALQQPVKSHDP